MARKRGGLAGVWDRNKHIIKPVASLAAGAINPALGAALGAAMGGLDRPGQSGIGLDVKGAVTGGVTGYGLGKVGQAARGGISGLLTGGARTAGGAGREALSAAASPAPAASSASPLLTGGASTAANTTAGAGANAGKSFLSRNLGAIGSAAGAGAQALGAIGQQQANAASLDFQREQFDYQKEQDRLEQERRERIARLLAPLFAQQAADLERYRSPSGSGVPA